MIISMQGNWTVRVKSKSASYSQRFIINGATSGNGVQGGTVGNSVYVTGNQWTIAVQNNPGTGYQLSDAQIKFPRQIGGNYEFEIWTNDAGSDSDFNDLILACTTPVNINDFIVYGNASLYSGLCLFNPCRPRLFVIETKYALLEALKNRKLRKIIEEDYPERIPEVIIDPPIPDPPLPDPPPFKPIVIDLYNEAMQPKTELAYRRIENTVKKSRAKSKKEAMISEYSINNFTALNSIQKAPMREYFKSADTIELAKVIDGLMFKSCVVAPATNTTLTFEEYDRTAAELSGGPYTGTGNRRLLGDTITDMNGNYIFRFSFDMTFPGIEDSTDIAPGENINVVAYPDVIVKVTGYSPYTVLYESAPYYNIPNLKRINLCLPKSLILPSSACFNGNLIGSLGNVFLGGNQNSSASTSNAALRRYGNSNDLEFDGKISVGSSLAGFNIECASWHGWIDFKGCMYDLAKTAAQNKIRWYTIRIKRAGTSDWQFVSQNYLHPRFHRRNEPGYIGDIVGPTTRSLHVDGGSPVDAPAYKNIQREIFYDGIDWEFSNFDRYMQLNTRLYDKIVGESTPGTFYVRVDCYDNAGNPVPDGTDMIALYIHNNRLNFGLTTPVFTDASIVDSGCGLFRLTDAQMNTPIQLTFMANDPEGFVDSFDLKVGRCPTPMIALGVTQPNVFTTLSGETTLFEGDASANVPHTCVGYKGTITQFTDAGMITVEIQPAPSEGGWIKPVEYFTSLSFYLKSKKRVTNGYNTGLSDDYRTHSHIHMERISP